jgi:hypothetical protein
MGDEQLKKIEAFLLKHVRGQRPLAQRVRIEFGDEQYIAWLDNNEFVCNVGSDDDELVFVSPRTQATIRIPFDSEWYNLLGDE